MPQQQHITHIVSLYLRPEDVAVVRPHINAVQLVALVPIASTVNGEYRYLGDATLWLTQENYDQLMKLVGSAADQPYEIDGEQFIHRPLATANYTIDPCRCGWTMTSNRKYVRCLCQETHRLE